MTDTCSLLHGLAQILQLEVPHTQTLRLCQDGGVCEEFVTVTLSPCPTGGTWQPRAKSRTPAGGCPDGPTQT